MEKKLSWVEIKKQYDQEWVELVDVDWPDEEIDPRSGVVRVHDKDHEEFYRRLSELPAVDSAVVFVGRPELPNKTLTSAAAADRQLRGNAQTCTASQS